MKDIKQVIKDKGQTISSVATALGIKQATLSEQIKNKTYSVKRAEEIAKILGCSLSEMFAENDDINIVCPNCGSTITLKIVNKPTK